MTAFETCKIKCISPFQAHLYKQILIDHWIENWLIGYQLID